MIRLYALVTILIIALAVVAWNFVEPAPPRHLVIATGDVEGGYHKFASLYAARFAAEGITLELRPTSGSVENLELLADPDSGVDLAFVQGGTRLPGSDDGFQTVGCMYFEPLWLFHRRETPVVNLTDLKGRRVAVGGERSGVRPLVLNLLEVNGIGEDTAQLRSVGGGDAARELLEGGLDAAFFIMSAEAPIILELLSSPDLELSDFRREAAYLSRFRFLSSLTLAEGLVSLADNIPPTAVKLLAPTANLVARGDLHPAFADLALLAASEVHARGGMMEAAGQFPTGKYADYPLSPDAVRFLEHGPSFLQRYLPFWLATQIDRLKVMILPFVMLLLPLGKLAPAMLQWRVRSKFYRIYGELVGLENSVAHENSLEQLRQALERIRGIEESAAAIRAPKSYSGELYNLRMHVRLVRERVMEQLGKYEIKAARAPEQTAEGGGA